MKTLPNKGLIALMVAAPLTLGAADLNAQAQETPAPCEAEVAPTPVFAGAPAQRVVVQLSQPIGTVDAFDSEAALRLSTADELPRSEMAAEGEEPQPVAMAASGRQVTLWVNTNDAEPGTYGFILQGQDGTCQGELNIEPNR